MDPDAETRTACADDQDCDDGRYCNGEETCDATHPDADAVTHCAGGTAVTCDDGVDCTTDVCDEASEACRSAAPDEDSDGHGDALCLDDDGEPLGTDCDDEDADRFPGNAELCDPTGDSAAHDEDCDATTIGTRDEDGDTHIDDRCCNPDDSGDTRCGDDCNDDEDTAYAGADEVCDGIDNDCDADRAEDNGLFCGACMCSIPNATPNCLAGPTQCTIGVCDTGSLNCDMDQENGCESSRSSDTSCGECGNQCTEHASCAAAGNGTFECECDAGFEGDGVACENVDECDANHGGCDSLVSCTDEEGGRACGACPAGYSGDGEAGCDPVLIALGVSSGALSPALDDDAVTYTLYVPVAVQRVLLTPSVASGVSIEINAAPAASGAAWMSPVLALGETAVEIEVAQAGREPRSYTLTITRGGPIDYLKASNTGYLDYFGQSLAIDGETLVVGTGDEDSAASSVNGDETDENAEDAGAAYVFVRSGQSWTQQAYLKASNAQSGDLFGWSVAISGDTIAVAARGEASADPLDDEDNTAQSAGAVFVFVRNAGVWTQQAYLKAAFPDAGDHFGDALALDGDTLVIGAADEASFARVIDGDQTNDGASSAGAAYVFERTGSAWAQAAYLKADNADANDWFGYAVAMSGDTVVVGALGESSNATTINGNGDDNSQETAGAAYVFSRSVDTWEQQAYLKPANAEEFDRFGGAVAISGDTIVVGALGEDSSTSGVNSTPNDLSYDQGAAYVFERSSSVWSQAAYLKASNGGESDIFGASVAIEGDTIAVGAPGEASAGSGLSADPLNDDAYAAGAAYVFSRTASSWSEIAYLKALAPDASDELGFCVALSDGVIATGALSEDGNGTGATGDPDNNDEEDSGAVYIFR